MFVVFADVVVAAMVLSTSLLLVVVCVLVVAGVVCLWCVDEPFALAHSTFEVPKVSKASVHQDLCAERKPFLTRLSRATNGDPLVLHLPLPLILLLPVGYHATVDDTACPTPSVPLPPPQEERMIHLPMWIKNQYNTVIRSIPKLREALGRDPTPKELAAQVEIDTKSKVGPCADRVLNDVCGRGGNLRRGRGGGRGWRQRGRIE